MSDWIEWDVHSLLKPGTSSAVALLILNQPLTDSMQVLLRRTWEKAALKVAVDGGLNALTDVQDNGRPLVPDVICGDFDSLSQDTLTKYSGMGSKLIRTPDQDETDFTKSLRECSNELSARKLVVDAILVFVNTSGRLDHVLGNLDTLYKAREISDVPVFLLGDNSICWSLEKGRHRIIYHEEMARSHVGLIPLGHPCPRVTTNGLVWNLKNDGMEFGKLVSICNRFDGSEFVSVESDEKLIWTMEFEFGSNE